MIAVLSASVSAPLPQRLCRCGTFPPPLAGGLTEEVLQ